MTNSELRVGGRHVATALVALSLATGSITANESNTLAGRIETVIARPAFRTSTFGILIAHVDSGRVLHEHNAEKLFAPASNTKLLSCGGALA